MNFISFIFSNTIVAFIILISIIVFVHELGHFLAGKFFKIQIEEFSIGFGPVAYSFKKGPTIYRINWLPLGGYVRFYGADIEENISLQNQEKSLLHAKIYKRAIVSFAGPLANFILSFFIMLFLVIHGLPTQPTQISVLPHSIAENSGLLTGDKIIAINNESMSNWPELVKKISTSANKKLILKVERNHKQILIAVTPSSQSTESIYGTQEKSGKVGITPFFSQPHIVPIKNDFFTAIGLKADDTIININSTKINYFHEIFIELNKITGAYSDKTLAQKILSNELTKTMLTISIMPSFSPHDSELPPHVPPQDRTTKLKQISVNFNSSELKQWALKLVPVVKPQDDTHKPRDDVTKFQEDLHNLPWSQITPSSDLTIAKFNSSSSANSDNLTAWKACGLSADMTIRSLNDLTNMTSVLQIYSFFESIENNFAIGKLKFNEPFLIRVKAIDANGFEKNFSCNLIPSRKTDALNKQKMFIDFPVLFRTQPVTLPAVYLTSHSFSDALNQAFHYLLNQMLMIYNGLKMLFSGSIPLSNLGGPIAIASIAGDAAKAGFITFLLTMSFISVNIGMVNLLPLPALDGGSLLLYAVEASYGKPLPKKVQILVQRVGIFIILFLFVLVFYNDILRLFQER